MAQGQTKKKPNRPQQKPQPSPAQLATEYKHLKTRVDELRGTVNKLKDILHVEDNWHSRTSKWIGKQVQVYVCNEWLTGRLLWTDRYNVGIRLDNGEGEEILGKGHVARMRCIGDE